MMCLCPTNVISRLLTISGKYELYKRRYIVCTLWMCWKHYLFYLFSSQMEQFKHEYLRSRAYIRLSLSSPFSHYRYSNLTTIEILVLLSWIPASKEFLKKMISQFFSIFFVKIRLLAQSRHWSCHPFIF